MADILKKVDKSGLAWGAFAIPQDLVKKGVEASPQLKVLEGVKALTLSFDYQMTNFVAEIRTVGGTKEQNENLAAMLNGFKAMGAMFAAEEPAVGDLLNGIDDRLRRGFHPALDQRLPGGHGQARQAGRSPRPET